MEGQLAGGPRPARSRGRNYDGVRELVAAKVAATSGRISAKRLLPTVQAAGYAGSARNFRRLVAAEKQHWRWAHHRRYQLRQPGPLGHGRRQQPMVRHQIPLIEAGRDTAQVMRCSHPLDAFSGRRGQSVASLDRPCKEGIYTFTACRSPKISRGSEFGSTRENRRYRSPARAKRVADQAKRPWPAAAHHHVTMITVEGKLPLGSGVLPGVRSRCDPSTTSQAYARFALLCPRSREGRLSGG